LKFWPYLGVAFIQAFLFLAHWFIYRTCIDFFPSLSPSASHDLKVALVLLSLSFIVAALLAFRLSNWLVALFYKFAAVWLGFLNFIFFAACLCWPVDAALRVASLPPQRPLIAAILFGLAILAGLYGLINAIRIRIHRVPVELPNLPDSWRGRTAVLLSDLHLGNVNAEGFCRRVVGLINRLQPDIVFLPGDFFDGTPVNPDRLAAPFRQLTPPFGIYFSTGNHDEFGKLPRYLQALKSVGIRVLSGQCVIVDGLQVVGISYRDSTSAARVTALIEKLRLSPDEPSILLNHVPNRLPQVEQAGISLQLSGHTHGGQIFPFTWLTRRVFGKFTHGLQRSGALQVFTSYGVGTWGPPMRVGTYPEIVVFTFELGRTPQP
jgi:predicted MPP superfamily phosphohydrolase